MDALVTWWKNRGKGRIMPWLRIEPPSRISLFDRSSLLLLIVASIWYFTAYLLYPSTPGNTDVVGWWGAHDFGVYRESTINLSQGLIRPSEYWIGYPLLGVPFYGFMPKHPYFIPNILLVMVIIGAFFGCCRHLMSRVEAWALVILVFALEPVFQDCVVQPWNTIPAYAAVSLTVYLLIFRTPGLGAFALCAGMAGLALSARPAELWPLAALYLAALPRLGSLRRAVIGLGLFGGAAGLAVAINLGINLHLYGQINSPYMISERAKLHVGHYALKVYQFLCDGTFLTGQADVSPTRTVQGLLQMFPCFALALPGAIYLGRRFGLAGWGLPGAIFVTVAFYLFYTPFTNMPYLWSYGSYHYVWWIVPWLALFTWLTFRHALFVLPGKVLLPSLLLPPLVALLISVKTAPVAVWDDSRNELQGNSSYQDRTLVVNLITPAHGRPLDLRFKFARPPSFHATIANNCDRIKIWVNHRPMVYMSDFMASQHGDTVDISFLSRSRIPWPHELIVVAFVDTDEPVVSEVSLQEARVKIADF